MGKSPDDKRGPEMRPKEHAKAQQAKLMAEFGIKGTPEGTPPAPPAPPAAPAAPPETPPAHTTPEGTPQNQQQPTPNNDGQPAPDGLVSKAMYDKLMQSYRTLLGKYNKEVAEVRGDGKGLYKGSEGASKSGGENANAGDPKLMQTINELQGKVEALQAKLDEKAQKGAKTPAPAADQTELYKKMEEEFGPEAATLMVQYVQHAITPIQQHAKSLAEAETQKQAKAREDKQSAFFASLDAALPNWPVINDSEDFWTWAEGTVKPGTGQTYGNLVYSARDRGDAGTVASLMKEYASAHGMISTAGGFDGLAGPGGNNSRSAGSGLNEGDQGGKFDPQVFQEGMAEIARMRREKKPQAAIEAKKAALSKLTGIEIT
jgi:hypothetical protein